MIFLNIEKEKIDELASLIQDYYENNKTETRFCC